MSKNDKPSYYKQLGEMIKTIKKETGWRNIFNSISFSEEQLVLIDELTRLDFHILIVSTADLFFINAH